MRNQYFVITFLKDRFFELVIIKAKFELKALAF